ncbi:hypothetical protein [Streptomyces sp. S.PNR 29]|nr:hypothetical protein [Streptomyces sp. S.PNR 29]MDN0198842.1 hypothetical protein [Streptomyces sp. S.PNR 29]
MKDIDALGPSIRSSIRPTADPSDLTTPSFRPATTATVGAGNSPERMRM